VRHALRGRVLTGCSDLADAEVLVVDDTIASVTAIDSEAGSETRPEHVIVAGLVDVHCHGGGGASFTSGDAGEVATAARHHLEHGTTTLVASTVSDTPERMLRAITVLADAVDQDIIRAIHLEGPFLSPRFCGAHDPALLAEPDLELAGRLLDAGRGHVRVVTLAPELPGAGELAAALRARGVVVSVGHTAADAATVDEFLHVPGHDLVTHLFNGMPVLHHREPGAVGGSLAAAARGDVAVELIADGVHLADHLVATAFSLLGADRIALVTDAMAAAGMPDGVYDLGPRRVRVRDGRAELVDGASRSLAGGTASLVEVVGRLVRHGLDPHTVVNAATRTPARVLGRQDVGGLEVGRRADLVVLDRDFRVARVMRGGRWVR
jgi:N-acetylglucosamine-6-phosphate deacetylase